MIQELSTTWQRRKAYSPVRLVEHLIQHDVELIWHPMNLLSARGFTTARGIEADGKGRLAVLLCAVQ